MTSWVLKRPLGWFLVFLSLTGIGLVTLSQLPVYLYPATEKPQWTLTANIPGWGAVDFRDAWGTEVENLLQGIDGVELVSGEYRRDRARYELEFAWNVSNDDARSRMESMRETVRGRLGTQASSVSTGTNEGDNAGYLNLALFSDVYTPEDLSKLATEVLEPSFGHIKELESISISKIEEILIEVKLNPLKLLTYGLTIRDVRTAIGEGKALPIASLSTPNDQFNIRLKQNAASLYEIEESVIVVKDGRTILLRDIGEVVIKYSLPGNVYLAEGKPAIIINAVPKPGENVRTLSVQVKALVDKAIADGLLPSVNAIALVDPAEFIDRSISNVVNNAVIGALLAMIAILFTLGKIRNTALVISSIPLSIIISFNLMGIFNVSLNLVSLGGLSLAVGMVVDSAVVMMENIHRIVKHGGPLVDSQDLDNRIGLAGNQVQTSLVASTLTSVLVFFPVTLTSPLATAILGDVAYTVMFALMASLAVALIFVPVLARILYKKPKTEKPERIGLFERIANGIMKPIAHSYRRTLEFILHRKAMRFAVLLAAPIAFILAIVFIFPLIPQEIMAKPSSDRVVVFLRFGPSLDTAEKRLARAQEIEAKIRQVMGETVLSTNTRIGERFAITIARMPSSATSLDMQDLLRESIEPGDGEIVSVNSWDPAQLPLPNVNTFEARIYGSDPQVRLEILAQARAIIDESAIFRFVRESPSLTPALDLILSPRREIIADFPGLTVQSLTSLVSAAVRPEGRTDFYFDEETYSLEVMIDGPSLNNPNDLLNYPLLVQGRILPVKHFFDLEEVQGLSQLLTEDGQDVFALVGNLPRNIASAEEKKAARLAATSLLTEKLKVPGGYRIEYIDSDGPINEAVQSLILALLASIVLIYLFLAFQFNSLTVPAVILSSIPFGLTGALLSLAIFGSTISLNSLLGVILLGGIVVNNAIMLIDFYHQEMQSGSHASKLGAIAVASGLRLVPILITAGTTILGMLPLALALGDGANILQPLGIAVTGGLFVSTLVTLFWVPAFLLFMPAPKQTKLSSTNEVLS